MSAIVFVILAIVSCSYIQEIIHGKYHTLVFSYNNQKVSVKIPIDWPDFQNINKNFYKILFNSYYNVVCVYTWQLNEKPDDWYDVDVLCENGLPILMNARFDGQKHYYLIVEGYPLEVDAQKWKENLMFFYNTQKAS